jgi:hypothetical protein
MLLINSIRDQIKDACEVNLIDYETSCDVADSLGLDGPEGDVCVNVSMAGELLKALKALTNICEDNDQFPIHTEKARAVIARAERCDY